MRPGVLFHHLHLRTIGAILHYSQHNDHCASLPSSVDDTIVVGAIYATQSPLSQERFRHQCIQGTSATFVVVSGADKHVRRQRLGLTLTPVDSSTALPDDNSRLSRTTTKPDTTRSMRHSISVFARADSATRTGACWRQCYGRGYNVNRRNTTTAIGLRSKIRLLKRHAY